MSDKPIQHYYPDDVARCYGCGRFNEHGLHIESYWDGREGVCAFQPEPYHTAIAGYVYGGLIASLIDCHCMATAAAAFCVAQGRELDAEPRLRYVTASLQVTYLKPTPLGPALEVRARPREVKGRKVILDATVSVDGDVCARGEVVAVQLPDHMVPRNPST